MNDEILISIHQLESTLRDLAAVDAATPLEVTLSKEGHHRIRVFGERIGLKVDLTYSYSANTIMGVPYTICESQTEDWRVVLVAR